MISILVRLKNVSPESIMHLLFIVQQPLQRKSITELHISIRFLTFQSTSFFRIKKKKQKKNNKYLCPVEQSGKFNRTAGVMVARPYVRSLYALVFGLVNVFTGDQRVSNSTCSCLYHTRNSSSPILTFKGYKFLVFYIYGDFTKKICSTRHQLSQI